MKRLALVVALGLAACTTAAPSEPEDEFVLKCSVGKPRASSWDVGTAHFRAHYCSSLGQHGTTDFRIFRIRVVDSNPALPETDRRPVVLAGKDLTAHFFYRYNHLNACDSFNLRLPQVEYAATGPANAGCGQATDHAPERTFADQNPATLARVRYGEGIWQNRELPCGHWLFQCGD